MIEELAQALTAARERELDRISTGMLEEGFLGVTGEALVGKTLLTRTAAAQLTFQETARVVQLDLTGAYSVAKLVARWRHALLSAVAGPSAAANAAALPRDFWPADTERAILDARELLGDQFDAAISEQPAKGERPRNFAQPINTTVKLARASDRRCVLMLDHLHAPLLTTRHPIDPRELLWQIRSAAQHIANLHVVAICPTGSEYLAADPNAAFYGDGLWLTITAPTAEHWRVAASAVGSSIDPESVRLGQGHVPTLLAMLHLREDGRTDAREAFRAVADTQHQHAVRCLLHASSLHRLGAHVLVSIANGDGPYAGTPEARSDDVAATVSQLRLAGLIRRNPEDDRGWLTVDPTIRWLLAEPMNLLPDDPAPDLTRPGSAVA